MQILIQTTVYTQVKEQKLPQLYTSLSLSHTRTEPQIYNSHTHTHVPPQLFTSHTHTKYSSGD